MATYTVQVGKGKGAYRDRYTFDTLNRAYFWYSGINSHSGGKKRLIGPDDKIIHRLITQPF